MLLTLSYPRLPLERIDVTTGYLVMDELAATSNSVSVSNSYDIALTFQR